MINSFEMYDTDGDIHFDFREFLKEVIEAFFEKEYINNTGNVVLRDDLSDLFLCKCRRNCSFSIEIYIS